MAKDLPMILLVDDEDIIIDVASAMLNKIGYEVLTAGSGEKALALYQANRDDIDLIILDLVMPGMNGGETYDRLRDLNPDIRVILSSGYTIDGQAQAILDRGCNGFIQKPFDLNTLSQKIKDLL
jgi:two-component system cell cycle sensor histidine kinase/response regulator CckA